jgi:hypothetical protein
MASSKPRKTKELTKSFSEVNSAHTTLSTTKVQVVRDVME